MRLRAIAVRFCAAAGLCALLAAGCATAARAQAVPEYKVKAEFLVKLAQFADWPASAFESPGAPFVIAIAGEDLFGPHLSDIAAYRKVKGRPIQLLRLKPGAAPRHCHLLFVARSDYGRLPALAAWAAGRPVLTVGDGEKFARGGAQVGVYRSGDNIRFEINMASVRAGGITLSSKLLRLAAAVHGEAGRD